MYCTLRSIGWQPEHSRGTPTSTFTPQVLSPQKWQQTHKSAVAIRCSPKKFRSPSGHGWAACSHAPSSRGTPPSAPLPGRSAAVSSSQGSVAPSWTRNTWLSLDQRCETRKRDPRFKVTWRVWRCWMLVMYIDFKMCKQMWWGFETPVYSNSGEDSPSWIWKLWQETQLFFGRATGKDTPLPLIWRWLGWCKHAWKLLNYCNNCTTVQTCWIYLAHQIGQTLKS